MSVRQMTPEDVPAVARLQIETFGDLHRRFHGEDEAPRDPVVAEPRIRHLLASDPGGSLVAEEGGELRGAALALLREGIWGLSLLVVDPAHQSGGHGRELMRASLAYGSGARGGLIVSSEDARALRLYFRAGFDLRPVMDSDGPLRRRPAADPAVRRGRWPADREVVDAAGRFVRGAGHGPDVPPWLAMGGVLYVHDDGGFAVRVGGTLKVVAARDPEVAAALLRTALHEVPDGEPAGVHMISAGQDWAVATVLDAGMPLKPSGAIMARGEVGPLAPYLPSGAYL